MHFFVFCLLHCRQRCKAGFLLWRKIWRLILWYYELVLFMLRFHQFKFANRVLFLWRLEVKRQFWVFCSSLRFRFCHWLAHKHCHLVTFLHDRWQRHFFTTLKVNYIRGFIFEKTLCNAKLWRFGWLAFCWQNKRRIIRWRIKVTVYVVIFVFSCRMICGFGWASGSWDSFSIVRYEFRWLNQRWRLWLLFRTTYVLFN